MTKGHIVVINEEKGSEIRLYRGRRIVDRVFYTLSRLRPQRQRAYKKLLQRHPVVITDKNIYSTQLPPDKAMPYKEAKRTYNILKGILMGRLDPDNPWWENDQGKD